MNRDQLIKKMQEDSALWALSNRMKKEAGTDPAHDWHHAMRVAQATLALLTEEKQASALDSVLFREAVTAALMHDIVNLPKNSPDRSKASLMAAEKARPILAEMKFSTESIERIAGAIEDHSFSSGRIPRTDLGNALQDADRLEALGTIGLFRLIATGVRMNAVFFENDDPWAANRPLDDLHFSVDHCFTKLLKLPASFRTKAGRKEALKRTEIIVATLKALGEELGSPLPAERLSMLKELH